MSAADRIRELDGEQLRDAATEIANAVDVLEELAENALNVTFGQIRQAVAHLQRKVGAA